MSRSAVWLTAVNLSPVPGHGNSCPRVESRLGRCEGWIETFCFCLHGHCTRTGNNILSFLKAHLQLQPEKQGSCQSSSHLLFSSFSCHHDSCDCLKTSWLLRETSPQWQELPQLSWLLLQPQLCFGRLCFGHGFSKCPGKASGDFASAMTASDDLRWLHLQLTLPTVALGLVTAVVNLIWK
jgi:hypothetical protein